MMTRRIASRRNFFASAASLVALLLLACSSPPAKAGKAPAGFTGRFAKINGVKLHYFIGGTGSPVVLLHGCAETCHMWFPIMPQLSQNHTVIAPDLRGAGDSSKPESGYDKKNMAVDVHALVEQAKLVATNVRGQVIAGSGHWLMEEAPQTTIPAINQFLYTGP